MRVIDPDMRALFSGVRRCEMCGYVKQCDCHHVSARGAGGGKQLDIRINLASACRECHNRTGNEPSQHLWERIVADRERETLEDIAACKYLLWRLPKRPSAEMVRAGMKEFTAVQQRLFKKNFDAIPESGK